MPVMVRERGQSSTQMVNKSKEAVAWFAPAGFVDRVVVFIMLNEGRGVCMPLEQWRRMAIE